MTQLCLEMFLQPIINNQKSNSSADSELYCKIGLLPKHFSSFEVIGRDFNHNRFKTALPKFKQYNNFKTRGVNMLDSWCTQTTNTHTRQPPDPTWSSFHYACTCLQTSLKHRKPMTNRGCSLSTSTLGTLSEASRRDHINIQEYAKTVTSNTAQCTEDVTVGKNFTTCGNQKTWKTTEVLLPADTSLLTALGINPPGQ